MSDENSLKQRLPAKALERLQTLMLRDGVATLIFDAAGLDQLARDRMEIAVRDTLRDAEGVSEVRVALMADKPRRRILAVGSGKGGVGKSTLAANLAIALAKAGRKVGIVDADIYGPSQPKLLGTEGDRPRAEGSKLIPVPSRFGIPMLSMGHLVEAGKAIAWRGPMAGNALGQLIDAEWGDTELLVVDLPPGTGDVQLTMLQKYKPDGAVIVSTPQDLALIDAQKAIDMLRRMSVPVLGLVENMSYFIAPDTGYRYDIFGTGGAEKAATRLDIPFLGPVPLVMSIREGSDAGTPPLVTAPDGPEANAYRMVARRLVTTLA